MKKAGFLVAVLLALAVSAPALAAGTYKTIQVAFVPVRFVVDGVDKTPPNHVIALPGGGSVPAAFIYKGVTYVPIRYLSEALGKSVSWDGSTETVSISDQPPSSGSVSFASLEPYFVSTYGCYVNPGAGGERKGDWCAQITGLAKLHELKMGGKVYGNGVALYTDGLSVETYDWNLDGKFSSLDMYVGEDDEFNAGSASVEILGDGRTLASVDIGEGGLPKHVHVNVTGVSDLRMKVSSDSGLFVDLADPVLTP